MISTGTRKGTDGTRPQEFEDVWSPAAVREALMAAARVIMAAPHSPRDIPMELRVVWPDVVHSRWDGGGEDSPRVTRLRPNAAQIDSADIVVAWLMWIDNPRDRRVVAARVFGVKWKTIARFDGRGDSYLRGEFWERRLAVIARHLQEEKKTSPRDLAYLTRFG